MIPGETTHLADVNVLLALLWPRHEGHTAAQMWFATSGFRAWATNPLTQLGVLRLLTNPRVSQATVGATAALSLLSDACRHQGHRFWSLDSDLGAGPVALPRGSGAIGSGRMRRCFARPKSAAAYW